jgi:serine/threonine protein kinase
MLPSAQMRTGDVIADRFELLGHAGSGSNASVYRARDRNTERMVAVKILTPCQGPTHSSDHARFFREATVLSGLSHEHIVAYVSFGAVDGSMYLVQEWIEGETLAARLRTTGVTLVDAVTIAGRVADALAYIHAQGIIHRDVKPGNILLAGGAPARVKLADFGIARMASSVGSLTRTGEMVGTPSYMSPEQARGMPTIQPAADVWALGCVLYKMMTGRVAFGGKSPAAIRARVLLDRPLPLDDTIPEPVRDLITAMLARDPAERPADGAAVAQRLAALGELPTTEPRTSGTSEPPTLVLPPPGSDTTICYVFFSPSDPATEVDPALDEIASRHGLALHRFDDGTALLIADKPDRPGAFDAARAATELVSSAAQGGVSIFGQSSTDSFETAIERGAMLLDTSVMDVVFGDVTDLGDVQRGGIYIDDTIDNLLAGALPTARTEAGIVLRTATRRR